MFLNRKRVKYLSFFTSSMIIFCIILSIVIPNAYGFETFTDISENDYYYDAIVNMQQKGFAKGYPDSTFRPVQNVTIAEALSLIFRVAGVPYSDTVETELWYSDIMDRALSLGIVDSNNNPNNFATRIEIGEFIAKVYDLDIAKTTVSNVFVDTNTKLANTMYIYGIFQGSPVENGYAYMPNENITRADFCIVLDRLYGTLQTPFSGTFEAYGVTVNTNPTSYSDFLAIIKTLGIENNYTITIPYNIDLSNSYIYKKLKANCITAFEYCFSTYPEKYSFTPKISIKRNLTSNRKGNLIIILSNDFYSNEELYRCVSEFNKKTNDVISELTLSGKLVEGQTKLEKVKVLFEYIVVNTKYDNSEVISPDSFTGFGAAINKVAVCQGYSAFFNSLCKHIGVESEGVTGVILKNNVEHMWSRFKIDDIWYYCDVTYADPSPDIENYCDFTYFNVPYEVLMSDRVLDEIHNR